MVRRWPAGVAARPLLACLLVMAAVSLTTACGNTAGTETGVSIDDIQDDPDAYIGREATVSAHVKEDVSPSTFTIAGDEFSDVPALLVVARTANVFEDEVVTVTGTVRRFDVAQVEHELGVDLSEAVHREFAGKPCLLASRVERPEQR